MIAVMVARGRPRERDPLANENSRGPGYIDTIIRSS